MADQTGIEGTFLIDELTELERKDGSKVPAAAVINDKKVIGIYFSAHWCPPCRGFTPVLAKFYDDLKLTENGKHFEIIFVSSDKDKDNFDGYFKDMPWCALPFENRAAKGKLSDKFEIRGIPALVILKKDGTLITKDGRGDVQAAVKPENTEGVPWFKDL